MSFAFEGMFRDKDVAREWVTLQHAPEMVKAFIQAALRTAGGDPVHVKAFGHLCQGDYPISTCNIEVKPIKFTPAPA